MSKTTELHPSQQALAIEDAQSSTDFAAVSYLNGHEGLIELRQLPELEFDPERPMTYLQFAQAIGTALAEEPPESGSWDKALDVHGEDFDKASTEELNKGLYFSPALSIDRTEVVTASQGASTLDAPGVRSRREGVAVTGDEFRAIARSPKDFIKHIHAGTKKANDKRPDESDEKLDDETEENTAGRSMVHALRSKKEQLLKLDGELKAKRMATLAINRLVAAEDTPVQPMGDLDRYRLISDATILGTARVASDQLRYGTTVRLGVTRAIISSMFRGDPASMAAALMNYTKFAGYYIDAKRGKVYQSLSACQVEFRRHKHYLKTKA